MLRARGYKLLFSKFYKLELKITYVDAKGTSSLCPICGEKLSPNGCRQMKCSECGLEEDRDVIAVKNTRWMQELPFTPKALP
jgi:putative transposase